MNEKDKGQVKCTACPAGFVSANDSVTGQWEASECRKCDLGRLAAEGSAKCSGNWFVCFFFFPRFVCMYLHQTLHVLDQRFNVLRHWYCLFFCFLFSCLLANQNVALVFMAPLPWESETWHAIDAQRVGSKGSWECQSVRSAIQDTFKN
jgi:hypothetical protein